MQDLITYYLLLNRQVTLQGIGLLSILSKPAEIDTPSNKILPPADEFIFNEDVSNISRELVKYIARKKNIETNIAEHELIKFCQDWKQKIDSGNKLCFETVGGLQQNEGGIIFFKEDENVQYLQPLPVEIIYRETASALIEDNITKDEVIENDVSENIPLASDEYYNTAVIKTRPAWLKWAIILCAVAVVILLFHYYGQHSSAASVGNQSHFFITSPDSTYFTPKQ